MQKWPKVSDFNITKKRLVWYMYLIVLIPICIELALRIMSAEPYIQQNYSIKSSPENAFIGHDSLGIGLRPGTYKITHNTKHSFKTTHTLDKKRLVANFKSDDTIRASVAFFGCSFTYGYGVNDDEHYVSLIQRKYPDYKMANFGVIGYGTSQSLLQLNTLALQGRLPEKVVLGFATDHFERNALTNQYRRALKIGFENSLETAKTSMKAARFPYLKHPNTNISFENWDNLYMDWKGRDLFASVNFFQTQHDQYSDNQRDIVGISSTLIKKMRDVCKTNSIDFLVLMLDENERSIQLKQILKTSGVAFAEVNFNFESKIHTNLPYDMHPNAEGHKYIAKQVMPEIKTLLESD